MQAGWRGDSVIEKKTVGDQLKIILQTAQSDNVKRNRVLYGQSEGFVIQFFWVTVFHSFFVIFAIKIILKLFFLQACMRLTGGKRLLSWPVTVWVSRGICPGFESWRRSDFLLWAILGSWCLRIWVITGMCFGCRLFQKTAPGVGPWAISFILLPPLIGRVSVLCSCVIVLNLFEIFLPLLIMLANKFGGSGASKFLTYIKMNLRQIPVSGRWFTE